MRNNAADRLGGADIRQQHGAELKPYVPFKLELGQNGALKATARLTGIYLHQVQDPITEKNVSHSKSVAEFSQDCPEFNKPVRPLFSQFKEPYGSEGIRKIAVARGAKIGADENETLFRITESCAGWGILQSHPVC